MTYLPPGLSDRARAFLDEQASGAINQGADVSLQDAGVSAGRSRDLEAVRQLALCYRRDYEGRSFKVLGGPLEGTITLGCGPLPRLRESREGVVMFRAARHREAQCDIVLSAEGEFGCSWTGEFHRLYSTIQAFIEDCAIWDDLRGWRVAARVDGNYSRIMAAANVNFESALDLGAAVGWRIGDDVAIGSHAYLNSARGSNMLASVVVSDAQVMQHMLSRLEAGAVEVPGDPWRAVHILS